jgi:hypothetical protein
VTSIRSVADSRTRVSGRGRLRSFCSRAPRRSSSADEWDAKMQSAATPLRRPFRRATSLPFRAESAFGQSFRLRCAHEPHYVSDRTAMLSLAPTAHNRVPAHNSFFFLTSLLPLVRIRFHHPTIRCLRKANQSSMFS